MSRGFKKLLCDSISRISIRHIQTTSSDFQTIDLKPSGPSVGNPNFKKLLVGKRVNFVRGFIYDNSQPDIAEEHPVIHRYFRPRKKYVEGIESPVLELRKKNDIVLGVVIRHGDFKTWRNGEFYFETSEYVRLMDRAVEYLAPIKTGFFIASDEEQPREPFGKHCYYFRAGHCSGEFKFARCVMACWQLQAHFLVGLSITGKSPLTKFPKRKICNGLKRPSIGP